MSWNLWFTSSSRRHVRWGLTALLAVTLAGAPGGVLAETVSDWSEPETIAAFPPQPDEEYPDARVVVGPGDDAAASWLVERAAGGYRVHVSVRGEDGTWAPTGPLSKRVRENVTVDLAVDGDGDTSVVWERWGVDGPQVEYVRCDLSGSCTEPEIVGPGRMADVEVDRAGAATVAFKQGDVLRVRRRTDAGWGKTRAYRAPAVWKHSLDVNPDGDAMLSWFEWRTERTRAVVHRAGEGWPRPQTVMRDRRAFRVNSLMDRRGRAMFVGQTFEEFDEVARRYLNGIVWTKLRADGTWAPMRNYNDDLGEDGTLWDVAMNPRGQGLAVWFAHRGDDLRTEVARFDITGTWGGGHELSQTWSHSQPWVGIDGVARVVFEKLTRSTFINYVEHNPGEGWSDPVWLDTAGLTEADGGRTRMVYGAIEGMKLEGYELWARVLDVTAD